MKRILKIFKIIAIVTAAIIALLIVLSYIFQDAVTKLFINDLNKELTTDINVGKARFSLLKNFPKATIEFRDVQIASPDNIGSAPDSIKLNNLLEAGSLSASFRISKLLRKNYSIEKIVLEESTLFIETNGRGSNNLIIWKQGKRSDSSLLNLDLKNVIINNSYVVFWGGRSDLLIKGKIDNASGKIKLTGKNTAISVKAKTNIGIIRSGANIIVSDLSGTDINGRLLINPDSLSLRNCIITYNKKEIEVNGPIYTKDKALNLHLRSAHLDINTLKDFSPARLSELTGKNIKAANLSADMYISGEYKPENRLELKGDFYINKLRFKPGEKLSEILVSHLSSSVRIGLGKSNTGSQITINEYNIAYAGTDYEGKGFINNLKNPEIDLSINGNIDLAELSLAHKLPGLSSVSGNVRANIHLEGKPGKMKDLKLEDIFKLRRSANLNLKDLKLVADNSKLAAAYISGNIMIADNVWIDELSLRLSGQNIVLNGEITGIQNFIDNKDKGLEITTGIWADKLDLDILKPIFTKEKSDSASGTNNILDKLTAHITFNIDSLLMGSFHAAQLDGSVNYRNKLFNISSFNLLTMEGSVSGNAALTLASKKQYLARGWFELDNINVNEAFTVFRNFGQQSIKAENIEGYLSGSLSVSSDMGSNFKPKMASLNTTGNYLIRNGALINFEPAMLLSRFIEISELEEIRFEELKNDLVIKDSRLMIPTMDINSSAFNISLAGEQSFEGNFEYHLKVLLSEILGKKAKESQSYLSEFGTIEDDGFGKTTLFLKLLGGPDGTEVSYDVQQLSHYIKEDLKEEKSNLKTILNEEYGWYKSDSLNTGSEEKSRKFQITWEETGNVEQSEILTDPKGLKLFQRFKKRSDKKAKKDSLIKKS